MCLRPFQEEGSAFLQQRRAALLCDDAGTGKTRMVLDAADKLGLHRILCIGPAVAGVSWPIELQKWSAHRSFVDLEMVRNFGLSGPGVYFLSYDIVSQTDAGALVNRLRACPAWDLLVLDEGQYCKTPTANRTRAIYGYDAEGNFRPGVGLIANADRVWVLSGTLTPNHAGEAYSHLRALFPERLATIGRFRGRIPELYEFQETFCSYRDTVWGRVFDGSKNIPTLRAAIQPVLLRRLKRDVLPQLPALEWFDAPVRLDPEIVRTIWDTEIQARTGMDYETMLVTFDLVDPAKRDAALGELLSYAAFATARRQLGLAKVPGVAEWAVARLEAGEPKLLIFAWHNAVIDRVRALLLDYDPVVYTGATPPGERAAAVAAFQSKSNVRVFIGQLAAAGTAITLTAARTVLLAEYASTPGLNYQAVSRAHRMGQRDGVQAYLAAVPGTLDARIAALARRRAREIAELFD